MLNIIVSIFTWIFIKILWGILKLIFRTLFWLVRIPFTLIFKRRFPLF